MTPLERFQATNVALFCLALAHALWTWPAAATAALFLGGAAVAFVGEVIGTRLGLVEHALGPQVLSVPVTILLAWPAVVYPFFRVAVLAVPDGVEAALLAALLAAAANFVVDPIGVREGLWTYPDSPVSAPRFRGVPWWNFVAWVGIAFVTALLSVPGLD